MQTSIVTKKKTNLHRELIFVMVTFYPLASETIVDGGFKGKGAGLGSGVFLFCFAFVCCCCFYFLLLIPERREWREKDRERNSSICE